MDNSSVNMEVGFNCAFQYVTQFEGWLKAGLPWFCHFKFYKHSVACGKDVDSWQVLFFKTIMVKVKEDMIIDFKLISFI